MELLYPATGEMGSDRYAVNCEEKTLVGNKIPNHKFQIPNKFQVPNSNAPNQSPKK
jgi:hypothetical protein